MRIERKCRVSKRDEGDSGAKWISGRGQGHLILLHFLNVSSGRGGIGEEGSGRRWRRRGRGGRGDTMVLGE